MKKYIFLLLITFCLTAHSQCKKEGDSNNKRIIALNLLKNRGIPKGLIPEIINISDILKSGNDSTRWFSTQFVSVTGYIILVKYGGAETCNCHTKDKSRWDVHIELAAASGDKSNHALVCEAGVSSRSFNSSLTYLNIKKLIGKRVTITGYFFADKQHWANSVNINPKGKLLWRKTAWEIHPIANINLK